MAIFSDAGALVGTWWNQVTQPQASRGPITETTVNPSALTARTDLDEAGQALGQPLPIVIGTGRVDGIYFIGGVETVGTTTYTTTTDNSIPPGYQAVSGTIGGQVFQFGPGPRTTTTSTTTYDNRTLAGYVLAYDMFERGYDLVRLEIDGAVVYDIEAGIPETTTFRFYGGRHTTVDPILTQIIGTNPGAYQNFVLLFIDGYPADSPPSISAVISNESEGGIPQQFNLQDIITDAMSLAGFGPADLTFEGIFGGGGGTADITGTAILSWWQSTFEQTTNDQARMGIGFLNSAGVLIGGITWSSLIDTAAGVWTSRSVSAVAPGGARQARIYMNMHRRTGTHNDGRIDDISLTIGGEVVELFNPGAESGMTGWVRETGGSGGIDAYEDNPRSGSFVFWGGTDSADSTAYQTIGGVTGYGFVIASDTTVQAVGRALSDIYGFSWCDTGSGFYFKQAARGDLFSIDAAFGTPDIVERDQPVMSQDEANIRTPSSVEMQYVSKEGQYKPRPTSFNMTTGVLNSITTPKFSTPILFSDAEAQRIVQEKFFEYQEKRRSHTLAVAPENITLLPGDIVSFPSGTRTYITRVEEIGIDLRNMGVEISARDFQTDVETPVTAVSNTGPVWTVVYHASGDVAGQTLAVSVGTVTVTAGAAGTAFASVTGQELAVSVGTVTVPVGDVTASVTGQSMTVSVGTATVVGDPNFSSVKLLLGFNGTDAATSTTDESGAPHTMTFVGNAQLDTAQFKFGVSSLLLDGTGDYLTTPDSNDWDFSTGRFTVECWVRFNSVASTSYWISQWDPTTLNNIAWALGYHTTNGVRFTFYSGTTQYNFQNAWSPSTGVWYHVAVDRDVSGVVRVYIDGAMVSKTTNALGINGSSNPLRIGALQHASTSELNGWLDENRITKGVARYASDSGYTVPTAAFPRF